MTEIGDRFRWKFNVDRGSFHEIRLYPFYVDAGIEYNKEKPPHIQVVEGQPTRQQVWIELMVTDPKLFDQKREANLLKERFANIPEWKYEFVGLEADEDATREAKEVREQERIIHSASPAYRETLFLPTEEAVEEVHTEEEHEEGGRRSRRQSKE